MGKPTHPLLQLKEQMEKQAEERRKRRENEVVSCPECGVEVFKPDMEEAVETAEKHDDMRHDGEPTTQINGIVPPDFDDEELAQIEEAVEQLSELEDANESLEDIIDEVEG